MSEPRRPQAASSGTKSQDPPQQPPPAKGDRSVPPVDVSQKDRPHDPEAPVSKIDRGLAAGR